MKLNIKTLAACLLASSALVSCNNEFEDGASGVSYPEQIELGKWAPSYTVDGSNKYTLNLTAKISMARCVDNIYFGIFIMNGSVL